MKILRVIPSVNPAEGGPVEGLINSNHQLQQRGHTVEVASLDFSDTAWARDFAFPLHALGQSHSVYGYSAACRDWLDQHITHYDVVIIHGIWQYHTVAAAKACKKHGVPYLVFTHGMLDPWFKQSYPLKHLKKLAYWLLFLRRILRDARAVVFTTDEERLLARQSFPFYRCHETVVRYGTAGHTGNADEQRAAFLQAYPALADKTFSLFLSRIHPKKGVDILLQAFADQHKTNDDHWLVIAGPDETGWQAELEAMAENLGIAQNVIFTGMLSGDVKWGAYAAADCFVLPSHQENFGIVVAEALSAGLPVLITDKVNIHREVLAARAGLASADTREAFAGLLQQWQAMSPAEKETMRQNARQCFLQHFEITEAGRSLEALLLDTVA